jgi:hypothetical protein
MAAAAAASLAAAAVAVGGSGGGGGGTAALSLYGVAMGLLAATTNAAAFVTVGLLDKRISPLAVSRWQHGVTTAAALGMLALEGVLLQAQQQPGAAGGVADAGVGELWAAAVTHMGGPAGGAGAGAGADLAAAASAGAAPPALPLPSAHDAALLGGIVAANFGGQLLLNAGFQRVDAARGASVNTLQVRVPVRGANPACGAGAGCAR